MFQHHLTEDPEPSEPDPAGLLFVPVRPGPASCIARFFRTPLGHRTAVAFTTEHRLTATLGADHAWIKLSVSALRALATPLGITELTVDPRFIAQAPHAASTTADRPWRDWDPRGAGVLRVTGTAAVGLILSQWIG